MAESRTGATARLRILLPLLVIVGFIVAGVIGGLAGASLVRDRAASATVTVSTMGTTQARPVAQVESATIAGQVYQRVGKAVVDIVTRESSGLFGVEGSGSGVVIDSRGLILTAAHVVSGASSVEVRFANGETREGTVAGIDQANDLALVRVDRLPDGIPVASLGDSDAVQVGDVAIAIGSPFGLSGTVTQGIISAVDRSWRPSGGRLYTGLIQTDAAVNPGNSGGPLLNANGEVIGIVTMIDSPIQGNVGIGFAVPSNTAKRVLPQLEAGAKLEPAWLGISGTDLDANTARRFGLNTTRGVIVLEVVPGSPAARAGLRAARVSGNDIAALGDVIVGIDGQPIENFEDLAARVAAHQPGDTVTLTILRDGQEQRIQVTLGQWPTNS